MLPFDLYFVNVGKNTISDVFIAFFCDMDVGPVNIPGYYDDNYACYFADLRTPYTASSIDHGSTPMGLTLLGASKPLDSLLYLFRWPEFYSIFENDTLMYRFMSGLYPQPSLIQPCMSPSAPTDSKFLYSFGPFGAMKPGDTVKVSVAFVGGSTVQEGPNNLYDNVKKAIVFYNRKSRPPIELPSPPLNISQHDTKVKIAWGHQIDSTKPDPLNVWDESSILAGKAPDSSWRRKNPPCGFSYGCGFSHHCIPNDNGQWTLPGGRIFGGYRIYRSEDQSNTPSDNSWTLLRQFVIPVDNSIEVTGLDTVYTDSNLTRDKQYWYSVTSYSIPCSAVIPIRDATGKSILDTIYSDPTESPISENQTPVRLAFSPSVKLGQVLVVPNPCRTDRDYTTGTYGWEDPSNTLPHSNRVIKFIHLRIMTVAGDIVATLNHNDPVRGELNWELFSESGHPLASGLYIFTVESEYGKQTGKFVIVR